MTKYLGVMTDDQLAELISRASPQVIDAIPAEGGTVTLPSSSRDMIVNLSPATTLNAVTLVLPNETSSVMGQRIFVASTRQITALTATGIATVNNAVVMFSPGDNVVFFKNKPNTWSRLIG
jgi:hypothetical protein